MRVLAFVMVLLIAAACEGPVGPTGPQGPQGLPGSTVRYTAMGTLDGTGEAIHPLPAGIGAADDLPVVTCFLSSDGSVWFTVLDGYNDDAPYCTIDVLPGALEVRLTQGPPGWDYFIAVVI